MTELFKVKCPSPLCEATLVVEVPELDELRVQAERLKKEKTRLAGELEAVRSDYQQLREILKLENKRGDDNFHALQTAKAERDAARAINQRSLLSLAEKVQLKEKLEQAMKVLERLASAEAFTVAQTIGDTLNGAELRERLRFAQENHAGLKGEG